MNILLIDEQPIVTFGLNIILKKEFPNCLIDIANSGDEAYNFFKKKNYQIVFLDLNFPNDCCTNILLQILALSPVTKVIIFKFSPEFHFAKRFYELGAKGYLKKDTSISEILKAVYTVLDNKAYISEFYLRKIADDLLNNRTRNPFDKLSKREFELTLFLAKGFQIKKIANIMNLHPSTVGTHKAKIFEKIGVDNIIELKDLCVFNEII